MQFEYADLPNRDQGMNLFKNHWYYWYTGKKLIAVLSMMVSFLVMLAGLVFAAGFSIWGVIIAILLDATGFWLAIIYLVFLRYYIPEFTGLKNSADLLVAKQLVVPMLVSFFVTRISSFSVAKLFGRWPAGAGKHE